MSVLTPALAYSTSPVTDAPIETGARTPRDNVASALRKKAAHAAKEDGFGTPTSTGAAVMGPPKFKTPLRPQSQPDVAASSTTAKKVTSIHSFKGSDVPIKRTVSAQNIASPSSVQAGISSGCPLRAVGVSRSSSTVKRTASSQNVSTAGGRIATRVTAPPGGAMACNAELLANFEKEKKALDRRISELIQIGEMRLTETEKLKYEIKNLRELIPSEDIREELELLRAENQLLRERLTELNVSVEHFTDAEKLLLLQRRNNVASHDDEEGGDSGASKLNRCTSDSGSRGCDLDIDLPGGRGGSNADIAYSLDCQWDKASNKSSEGGMSEVSVACLQDRILQMEETHYSTSEELQATLQELTDLQDTVNDLSSENDRLADEKYVLLESLCAQTEKLENARLQIEHLKALLLRDLEYGASGGECSENERQLVALLHGAEEEREELLLKQVELSNAVRVMGNDRQALQEIIVTLRERLQAVDTKAQDHAHTALRAGALLAARQQNESDAKLVECSVLDIPPPGEWSSTDKPRLPTRDCFDANTDAMGRESSVNNETVSRLWSLLETAQQELAVYKTQSKSLITDSEQRLQRVEAELAAAREEADAANDRANQLQVTCDQFADERTTDAHVVARLESEIRTSRQKIGQLEAEIRELHIRHHSEQDEWRQFHADLQTAVVIANEFKTEAEQDIETVRSQNIELQESCSLLKKDLDAARYEVERLKQVQQRAMEPPPLVNRDDIRGKVISTVDRELAVRRQGRDLLGSGPGNASSSLSVKHLISSIEEQVVNTVKNERVPPSSPHPVSAGASLNLDSTDSRSIKSVCSDPGYSKLTGFTSSAAASINNSIASSSPDKTPGDEKHLLRHSMSSADTSRESPRILSTGLRHSTVDSSSAVSDDTKQAALVSMSAVPTDSSVCGTGVQMENGDGNKKPLTGILTNKSSGARRRTSLGVGGETIDKSSPDKSSVTNFPGSSYSGISHLGKTDPLALLSKQLGGSKRNSLLKWCQNKTATYTGIDITNFSSSWNDGLAFCALLHTYLPDKIPYKDLNAQEKARNFALAFKAAESVNIPSNLDVKEMIATERPDWQAVMAYVTGIYKHFEIDVRPA